MTKNYFLDPNKLTKRKRNIFLLYGITGAVALVVIFVIQRMAGTDNPPWLAIAAIPILLVLVAGRSVSQQKDLWEHYNLTLEDDVFIQNQPNYPETRVALSSITGTEETKEGLYLKSKQGTRIFGIPRQLKDAEYEELHQIVEAYLDKKSETISMDEESEIDLQSALKLTDEISAVVPEAESVDEVSGDDLE